jgi:HEAT repeat protein
VLALGLLGDPAAVPALLKNLRDEPLAERAAMGLHLITGADLFESVDVPIEEASEPDDDEDAGEPGSVAQPATVPRQRPIQDPAIWNAWWEDNRRGFAEGTRYRAGEPASPAALVAALRAEHLPTYVRQLAGDELAIRYACDVPFESDWFVRDQLRSIGEMETWAMAGAFQPGAWYLAGRRLTV